MKSFRTVSSLHCVLTWDQKKPKLHYCHEIKGYMQECNFLRFYLVNDPSFVKLEKWLFIETVNHFKLVHFTDLKF